MTADDRSGRLRRATAVALLAVPALAGASDAPGGAAVVAEVCSLAAEHFVDPDLAGRDWHADCARATALARDATSDAARADVVNGLLDGLGVSHTRYFTADVPEYYELLGIFGLGGDERLGGRFAAGVAEWSSIGIVTRRDDGGWIVTEVLPGSRAEGAGILPGDRPVGTDDGPFHPVASFRGRAGTVVRLRLRGAGGERTVEVRPRLVRPAAEFERIVTDSARVVEVAGVRVGVVRLYAYTSPAIHETLVELVTTGRLAAADALVLDLRGGWGGASPDYLDLFNDDVPALAFVDRDGQVIDRDRKWRRPLVAVVDGGTRSGKEVLAHGIRSRGLGTLVGTRTAGAVVGGRPFLLADGSLLLLATVDVRVDGRRLEGVGVEPHVVVGRDLEAAGPRDPQLQAALRVAADAVRGER